MKVSKERIQAAIQEGAQRLFEDSGKVPQPKLYLTKKQYDLDPEGWKKMVRQKGLPESAIEIIPDVFQP